LSTDPFICSFQGIDSPTPYVNIHSFDPQLLSRIFVKASPLCHIKEDAYVQWGNRQQCGLHGPASGGGHEGAIGSEPDETRPAAALINFSIFFDPHFGQAGFSSRPTSSSAAA